MAFHTFYRFGQVLIDRIALKTPRKTQFTFSFNNEEAIRAIHDKQKGGFLFSAHVGNWENAGSLIGDRITQQINILMLDEEVEKIKKHLDQSIEKSNFNLIPLKEDMSHIILIHQALKRNELIALHADRTMVGQKTITLPFLKGRAEFPLGPFIMAHKFKVPVTFVFAVKKGRFHYSLSATDAETNFETPEAIAKAYVKRLETIVSDNPSQWFNFFEYYVD
jgi:predicted LPLAT superfamily acyltransferase